MPFVHIRMFPRTQEVKKALAEELTKVISKHCNITDDHTWIVFEDVAKESLVDGRKVTG